MSQLIAAPNDAALAIDQVRLEFNATFTPDYHGNLVLGSHYRLPDQFVPAGLNPNVEVDKSLMFVSFYNRSFINTEVLNLGYRGQDGLVAQWNMDSVTDHVRNISGFITGSPDLKAGFYDANGLSNEQQQQIYSFTANADGITIPYSPDLQVENSSFSFEATAIFAPYAKGISTILYKVAEDELSGLKKGFAVYLIQDTTVVHGAAYTDPDTIPTFEIMINFYSGSAVSGVSARERYTIDCSSNQVADSQYKRVFVSVDRVNNKLDFYIDKQLKVSEAIPAELSVFEQNSVTVSLDQISYITESYQQRLSDNPTTQTDLLNELQVLNDTLTRTVQPVWRPDTTYAVKVVTRDRVNGTNSPVPQTRILGFKTAGPLGHFHKLSKVYLDLSDQDQTNAFKFSSLQFYIDYNRSYPDAQGRYNLSKPVYYHTPQINLFFTEPYINAMYHQWDAYQGMPAVQSSLISQLVDSSGAIIDTVLVTGDLQTIDIDDSNLSSIPRDQQLLYLFNKASMADGCNPQDYKLVKKLQQNHYQFPDLQPAKLYTALFNASYQLDGADADIAEVYRFGFITSRYADLQTQAGSFILDNTSGSERYAIYPQKFSFSDDYIEQTLKVLINDDDTDDPASVQQYAVKYERIVFGGLQLAALEPFEYTAIKLVINTNPDDQTDKKLLGIIVYNPESFNDPKLPPDVLADTFGLTITLTDNTVVDASQFIYENSRDNSAVFITNTAMDIPIGGMQLFFKYKMFNGTDYITDQDYHNDSLIDLTPYFQA